mgnify:CR=1 FL=1
MPYEPFEAVGQDAPRPDAVLWIGPAGCGKTRAVIEEIAALRTLRAFGAVWVLLASGVQVTSFRQRLLAGSSDGVLFGVEFFNFEALYRRLLDRVGDPQRAIGRSASMHVLRRAIERLRDDGALEHFGPIAGTPGFVALAGRLITELKQGLVLPETFTQAAEERGPKDRDLARIYHAYQAFLQERELVDNHGAGWVALEHVRRGTAGMDGVRLLVVDGFDQFNRLHVELLTALARQTERTRLTLTQVDGARAPRFRRFVQTRDRLLAAGGDIWRIEPVPSPEDGCGRAAPLQHMMETVFAVTSQPAPAGDALTLIAAPDVGREVSAVLRRVKRRLLDGTPPESIAILTRDPARYSGVLRATARAYGVPLVVREGPLLRENPAVAAFLDLLDLSALDFPRRETLDVLRSPYLAAPGLDPEAIAALARISQERQVVRGRDAWLAAIRASARPLTDEDGEARPELAADPDRLADTLDAWFRRVTPPAAGTLDDLLHWVEALAGPDPEAQREAEAAGEQIPPPAARDHVNLVGQVRAGHDGEQVTRDMLALHALWDVLREIRAAHALVNPAARMPWAAFRQELELALAGVDVTPPGGLSRLGRVLATDVHEARGLPHDHVYLLGLAEGIFPAPQVHADLYQESERRSLAEKDVDLPLAEERADDISLFYQAVGLARQTLTLSRFTVDDAGAPVPPSPFWSAVLDVLDVPPGARERIPAGAAPGLEQAATPGEAAVAAASLLASPLSEAIPALAVHNALIDDAAWRNVLRGRALEARREDARTPFDRHTGLLRHAGLLARLAAALGSDRLWSASQLNDYGMCPFRFFVGRLLKLEALKEPEEGHDPLQLGSIYHAILEQLYHAIRLEGLAIVPDNLPRALALLDEVAAQVFAAAPERYGFQASAVWEQEQKGLLRRLRWLVERDFSPKNPVDSLAAGNGPRVPYALEVPFGMQGVPPVEIDGPTGPVRLRGVIDRLDRVGDAVVVIDYKSGSSKFTDDDLRQGRSVQMLVYLLAAQRLLTGQGEPARVIGGLYWHISSRESSGAVAAGDALLDEARHQVHAHIEAARAGFFAVRPSKPMARGRCAFYCDFSAMCRLTPASRRKAVPGGEV